MQKFVLEISNYSTCWSDSEIAGYLPILQKQITRDFAPVWEVDADVCFRVDKKAPLIYRALQVVITDDSDHAGYLGLHDMDSMGNPMGHVFAKTDLDNGEDPRRTLSHESLEILWNPRLSKITDSKFKGKPCKAFQEVCDAVEGDACGYEIDGAPATDFVTQAYFFPDIQWAPGTKFDFTGALSAPMTIADGGYMIIEEDQGEGWKQVFGENMPAHKRRFPVVGSRRERFMLMMNHKRIWQTSKTH